MKILSAEFVTSAPSLRHAPQGEGLPEIALLGRSNVGKSSLLSALVQRRNLARASRTPGRTRLLNFFLVNGSWFLVDLPGYGYARASQAEVARLARMTEEFLSRREPLVLAVQLIDARHGPQESDRLMFARLAGWNRSTLVVLTKADKLSRSRLLQARRESAAALGLAAAEILTFSSETGHGREELLARLARALLGPAPPAQATSGLPAEGPDPLS